MESKVQHFLFVLQVGLFCSVMSCWQRTLIWFPCSHLGLCIRDADVLLWASIVSLSLSFYFNFIVNQVSVFNEVILVVSQLLSITPGLHSPVYSSPLPSLPQAALSLAAIPVWAGLLAL